jgi:membrane protein implicated in regulation of membrane protease activity
MSTTSFWLILAAIMISCEIFTTTFYLLAIALGFLIAAAAASLNFSIEVQIGLSGLFALLAVLGVRQWKIKHPRIETPIDADDIGQRVEIDSWLDEQHARVKYRGSYWDAVVAPNQSSAATHAHWIISARHGATLEITPLLSK